MRNKKQYLRDYKENGVANCVPELSEEATLDTTVFTGRVLMIDEVRGFGFIIYHDHGVRRDIFFHVSNIVAGGEPVRRAKVTFQLKADEQDSRTTAGNIRVLEDSVQRTPDCRGHIDWFNNKRRFGYIISEDKSVFIHIEQVLRTNDGHRCFIAKPRTEVLFTLNERDEQDPYKKFFASDVRLAQDDTSPDCPEYSRVVDWSRNHQRGRLIRSCGCQLAFRADDIVTEGIESISLGDWVQHTTATDGTSWFATNVTLFEPGFEPEPVYAPGSAEEFFAASAEIPAEPIPASAEPSAFSSEEMKLPLKEIIRRRKTAA